MEIPSETLYCFQTGIRRSIRIEPIWTEWNKSAFDKNEEIYQLKVTCVYSSQIKVEIFGISITSLEEMINTSKDTYNIGLMLLKKYYNIRTTEQFDADLKEALDKFK